MLLVFQLKLSNRGINPDKSAGGRGLTIWKNCCAEGVPMKDIKCEHTIHIYYTVYVINLQTPQMFCRMHYGNPSRLPLILRVCSPCAPNPTVSRRCFRWTPQDGANLALKPCWLVWFLPPSAWPQTRQKPPFFGEKTPVTAFGLEKALYICRFDYPGNLCLGEAAASSLSQRLCSYCTRMMKHFNKKVTCSTVKRGPNNGLCMG